MNLSSIKEKYAKSKDYVNTETFHSNSSNTKSVLWFYGQMRFSFHKNTTDINSNFTSKKYLTSKLFYFLLGEKAKEKCLIKK